MRRLLLIVSAAGVLLFGSLFAVSMVKPEWIETSARTLLRAEIERRVGARIDALDDGRIAGLARRVLERQRAEQASLRRQLADGLPGRIAQVVAEMSDGDCAHCDAIEQGAQNIVLDRMAGLSALDQRLERLIRGVYVETAAKLMREFRIFTGANAGVFLLLGGVVWSRRDARSALLPAVVLVGGAAIVGGVYLFGQNWLHTLVFDSYLGYGYLAWLGLAVGFLADIAFNRARVTRAILDGIASVFSL